jgi:uncharacterized protein YdeI (YjbR/CyaY-like superfamily)
MPDLEMMLYETPDIWTQWLETHHQTSSGIWVMIAKKESGQVSVTYAEALEVALCFGWIDGQKQKLDEQFWLQRFTPRRPKSLWSVVNREKVEVLIAQGKMRAAGQREIDRAKQDGRWDAAYQPQSRMTVPEDFQQALDADEAARTFFETLNSANRYAILHRLHTAKKPETRAKRLAQFMEMLARGDKLHD